jgi:hypothetical protein
VEGTKDSIEKARRSFDIGKSAKGKPLRRAVRRGSFGMGEPLTPHKRTMPAKVSSVIL